MHRSNQNLPPQNAGRLPYSYLPGLLMVCIGAGLSYLLYLAALRWEQDRCEFDFKSRAGNMATVMQKAVEADQEVLRTMAMMSTITETHLSGSNAAEFPELQKFLSRYRTLHPEITALDWVSFVPQADRARYETLMQQKRLPDFEIRETGPAGKLERARDRGEYFPLAVLEPAAGREGLLGWDLSTDTTRWKTLQEARQTGQETSTPPLRQMETPGGKIVYQIFLPSITADGAEGSPGAGRNHLRGFAAGTVVVSELVKSSLQNLDLEGINFLLYDRPNFGAARLIYSYASGVSQDTEARPAGAEPVISGGIQWNTEFVMAGRRWWLLFHPSAGFLAAHKTFVPISALGAGLLLSLLFGLYVSLTIRRTVQVRRMVAHRTAELSSANQELQHEVQQRKLANSQIRRLSRAVEQSPSAVIILDRQGCVQYANPKFEEMTGRSLGDVTGHSFLGLTEDDAPAAQINQMWQAINAGQSWQGEYPCRRADGQLLWLLVSASPISGEDGQATDFVVVQDDITERKRAQEQLLDSEQRYRLLAENSNDLIALTTPDGTYTYVSPACRTILGYEPKELLGQSWLRYLHPEDRPEVEAAFAKVRTGGSSKPLCYRVYQKTGNFVWLETTARLIGGSNGHQGQGVIATSRDITERVQLEAQVRQAQKMEVIGRLAGGMAHDFNNYLTAILGFAQISLRQFKVPEALQKYLEEIIHTGQNAALLIKQLLAFARKQVPKTEKLNLDEILRGMQRLIETTLGEDVKLVLDLESNSMLEADAGQLKQVVTNLAVNARDAMSRGGNLTISTRRLSITQQDRNLLSELNPGEYALLSIKDTGCGMTPDVIRHAFEPFYTTKGVGKGTGLGLSTVYGIIKQMGGEIQIHSEVNVGTEFQIYLMRIEADSAIPVPAKPEHLPRGKETILVVEDNDSVRSVSVTLLRNAGYQVIEARDGSEALTICGKANGSIDMILTDVVMPQVGGPELVSRLQAANMNYKVVFTSGYNEHPFVVERRRSGDIAFIEKPFTQEELIKTVRAVLDKA